MLAVIGVMWFCALVVLFRIVIPSLIMQQNDGLLIIAYLLPIGFGFATFYLYRFIKENLL